MEHERGQIDSPTRAKRLSTSHYSQMVDADWSVKFSSQSMTTPTCV